MHCQLVSIIEQQSWRLYMYIAKYQSIEGAVTPISVVCTYTCTI